MAMVYGGACPTSPHVRDLMRRLLAPRCWEEMQAMIQSDTLLNIYKQFIKDYPDDTIGFTNFKLLKPWNLKKAYRETCLCRMCELFRLYMGGLHMAGELLMKAFFDNDASEGGGDGGDGDGDGVGDGGGGGGGGGDDGGGDDDGDGGAKELILELARLCELKSKSGIADLLVCSGCVEKAKPECRDGACPHCGFKRLWSKGVRKQVMSTS